jgi:hypothetical protein
MEKRFSGGSQTWDDPAYTVKGSNITPDPDTGIGGWSESDIRISLTEGLRPYGMPLAPQRYAARATDAVCFLQDHDGSRSRFGA